MKIGDSLASNVPAGRTTWLDKMLNNMVMTNLIKMLSIVVMAKLFMMLSIMVVTKLVSSMLILMYFVGGKPKKMEYAKAGHVSTR